MLSLVQHFGLILDLLEYLSADFNSDEHRLRNRWKLSTTLRCDAKFSLESQ